MQDIAEKKIRLDSATLAYFERNTHLRSKGPTLLFVHATGFHGRVWDKIINSIGKFHSISVDQRGHGRRLDNLFPSLRGTCDLVFTDPAEADYSSCDVVFFATPHNVAMREVPDLIKQGIRVVDLSADFRLRNVATWEHWYGESHAAPELCADAVYGLPETHRDGIRSAQLVACPGCYPTAVQLGFLPLLEADVIDVSQLIASCGSGVSGAGRQAKLGSLLTEAGESLSAYSVAGHRHLPEIEQGLSGMAGQPVNLTFVPHLVPMSRGIHATLFAPLTNFLIASG